MARHFVGAVVVILASLALVSNAQAFWDAATKGGETWKCENYAVVGNNHCYAHTEWEPNVNKKITNVFAYVTPEDVRFGELDPFKGDEPEFINMEVWAGWSTPGIKVGEPEYEEYWIEGGEMWQPTGAPALNEEFPGCSYFAAAKGYWGAVEMHETPVLTYAQKGCTKVRGAFFEYTAGFEPCVWWGEELAWCAPEGYLPKGPFTSLDGGTEISTGNEPVGLKGRVEGYATTGINQHWEGKFESEVWMTRQNGDSHGTCGKPMSTPGTIEFTAGADCPKRQEPSGYEEEIRWGEEPSDVLHAMQMQSSDNEESATTEGSKPVKPPKSEQAPFAYYSQTGGPDRALAMNSVKKEIENEGAKPSEVEIEMEARPSTYRTTGLKNRAIPQAQSVGQEAFLNAATVVVEMEGKPKETCGPDCEVGGPQFAVLKALPPHEGRELDTACCAKNVILVYNANTGQLIERETLYEETPGQKKRKLHRWVESYKTEQESKSRWKGWVSLAKRKMREHNPCGEGGCRIAEEWLEWQAELKAQAQAEKKQRSLEARERKRIEHEERGKASEASSIHLGRPRPSIEVPYRSLTIEAPESATITVRHEGRIVGRRYGRKLTARVRPGHYLVTVTGRVSECSSVIAVRRRSRRVRMCGAG